MKLQLGTARLDKLSPAALGYFLQPGWVHFGDAGSESTSFGKARELIRDYGLVNFFKFAGRSCGGNYSLGEALRLVGFRPLPLRYHDVNGKLHDHAPASMRSDYPTPLPEEETVLTLKYLQRSSSLVMDGIRDRRAGPSPICQRSRRAGTPPACRR